MIDVELLQSLLTPDLLKKGYEGNHKFSGHCYVASEAYFHLSDEKLKPCNVRHENTSHWFLLSSNGDVIDLTVAQFKSPPDYSKGRGRGFLTNSPSRRAQILIDKYLENI